MINLILFCLYRPLSYRNRYSIVFPFWPRSYFQHVDIYHSRTITKTPLITQTEFLSSELYGALFILQKQHIIDWYCIHLLHPLQYCKLRKAEIRAYKLLYFLFWLSNINSKINDTFIPIIYASLMHIWQGHWEILPAPKTMSVFETLSQEQKNTNTTTIVMPSKHFQRIVQLGLA